MVKKYDGASSNTNGYTNKATSKPSLNYMPDMMEVSGGSSREDAPMMPMKKIEPMDSGVMKAYLKKKK